MRRAHSKVEIRIAMGMMDKHWILCSIWKSGAAACRGKRRRRDSGKKHEHRGQLRGLGPKPELCPSSALLAVGKQMVFHGHGMHELDDTSITRLTAIC